MDSLFSVHLYREKYSRQGFYIYSDKKKLYVYLIELLLFTQLLNFLFTEALDLNSS